MEIQKQINSLLVVVLQNGKALDILTATQRELVLCLGKTVALGLIDQKFKLNIHQLTHQALEESLKDGSHGKMPGHGYIGFSPLGTSSSYFIALLPLVLRQANKEK
jgi:hypothetical protein